MRLRILSFFLLASWLLCNTFCVTETFAWPFQKDKKASIAVLSAGDFVPDATGTDQARQNMVGLPDIFAERMLEHLTTSKRFVALERKALRRAIMEQRFGKKLQATYMDRTLDKAISELDNLESGHVVAATGTFAGINDVIHDFKDLGSAVGADYLVVGTIEKVEAKNKETAMPYSTQGRKMTTFETDARLRLRVIEVSSSSVIGACSLRAKTSEQLFQGEKSDTDEFSIWDRLGTEAAAKVLDIVYPATVVNLDPLTISRGSNDGVQPNQTFEIYRRGKAISDASGATIAHLEDKIGKVQVISSDQNISLVKPIDNEKFRKGDMAKVVEQAPAQSPPSADTPPVALHKETPSSPPQLPKVAVGIVKAGTTASVQEEASLPIFTDTIITRLTQTKRFQVLDRQEVDQLLGEQLALAMSSGQDISSAFGSLKGADYFIYGNIAAMSIEEKKMKLPGSNREIISSDGYVQGNMRLVDVKSGQVVESRQVKLERRIDESGCQQRLIANLADSYADEVVASLMNAIYPIKVAAISPDGTIYLNRGSDGGLKSKEILSVMKQGQKVVDPDTGASLGAVETEIAKLSIIEIEDARSKAKVESGSEIQIGNLVKRVQNAPADKHTATPSPTGATLPGADTTTTENQPQTAPKGKATLAVSMVRLNPSARTTDIETGHMDRLTDELVNALNNSNRFVLMERREVDSVLDEKAFAAIASGEDIRNRVGQLKGADYLIMGEVTNLYYDTESHRISYVNEVQVDRTGIMEGNFRIVNGQTGAVVASDKVRLNKKVKNLQDPTQLITSLMDQFITQIVGKVVENIYPIKVLSMAQDGMVYINRGEDGGIKKGLRFDVFHPGAELKDPDTGVSFGREEIKVASVEIETAEKSRAKAKIIPGQSGSEPTITAGDILRQVDPASIPKESPKMNQPKW